MPGKAQIPSPTTPHPFADEILAFGGAKELVYWERRMVEDAVRPFDDSVDKAMRRRLQDGIAETAEWAILALQRYAELGSIPRHFMPLVVHIATAAFSDDPKQAMHLVKRRGRKPSQTGNLRKRVTASFAKRCKTKKRMTAREEVGREFKISPSLVSRYVKEEARHQKWLSGYAQWLRGNEAKELIRQVVSAIDISRKSPTNRRKKSEKTT